jgi:hypothetical protein
MTEDKPGRDFDVLKALWEEYRYRHELCWRVPLQTTAAAVILSTLPWAQPQIADILHWRILLVPLLGIVLTIFAVIMMWRELGRLLPVRKRYRDLQPKLLGVPPIPGSRWFSFRVRVIGYLAILCALQGINMSFLLWYWIPKG